MEKQKRIVKRIKGEDKFFFFFKGQMYTFFVDPSYNEKTKKWEAFHYGPKGGKYLVYWEDNNEQQ